MKDGEEIRCDGKVLIKKVASKNNPNFYMYYVFRLVDGVEVASKNGPWDYLANARRDADRLGNL